jgi:predicted TIM-barrel fold metal-dependent hydrolase
VPIYNGACVDPDVHHRWRSDDELIAYLPKEWRELVRSQGVALSISPPDLTYPNLTGVNKRLDAFAPDGSPPGSDYSTMESQLLSRLNVRRVVLSFDTGQNAAVRNPYLAIALARACNDWTIERWLERGDERLYGAMLTPNASPTEAAMEVRRIGNHPKIAEVLMDANALGLPFGNPLNDPIFAAAAEVGLPVTLHIGMDGYGVAQTAAGGAPGNRLEFHTLLPQGMVHHLMSFITHGVFEKFPDLKLLIVEAGVAWLPWLLQTMDSHYKIWRLESPWVRKWPSEYVRDHIKVTTQPLDTSADQHQLVDLLNAVEGVEDLLCFATDYPHWDADDPTYVAGRLPRTWLPKVFLENACNHYGWNVKDIAGVAEIGSA